MMGSLKICHMKIHEPEKKLKKLHKKMGMEIMSMPLWKKFRNVLRIVFGFHDMCLKIWSCFPHSFSEQFKLHMNSVETRTIS